MSNTPYVTTDPLRTHLTPSPIVGTSTDTLGFYGATGVAGPIGVSGATAGNILAALQSTQAALIALGLTKAV